MVHWIAHFDTLSPLGSVPRLVCIASETQTGPAYHHEGRLRQRETHCLFKYTLRGRGTFRDRQGEHVVEAGSGFLCEIRDPRTAYYYPADGKEPWTFVFACLEGTSSTLIVRELVERHGPVFRLPADRGIVADLSAFAGQARRRVEVSAFESGRLATDLLLSLVRSKQETDVRGVDAMLVRRVLSLVEERLDQRVSVTSVARELGVSREHLTRVFTEHLAVSPYQYILRCKMRRACHLLAEGRLTNKEVAARLGFSAPAHFTRAFRTALGMTPREFRVRGVMPVA